MNGKRAFGASDYRGLGLCGGKREIFGVDCLRGPSVLFTSLLRRDVIERGKKIERSLCEGE